jgi:hypothetical protein
MIDIHIGRKFYPSRKNPKVQLNAGPHARLVKVFRDLLSQGCEIVKFLSTQSRHGDL